MTTTNTSRPAAIEERCEKSDLFPSACAHCRPTPAWLEELRRELLAQPGWFIAVHPGTCVCGEDFAPGAAVRVVRGRPFADGTRHYRAECCADEAGADA
jgi:hypothetical protein